MITTAIIGLGYWGQKVLRNLAASPEFSVVRACDRHAENLEAARVIIPTATLDADVQKVFSDSSVELVVIVTQASTHFDLAKRALESGKHIFIEKPLAPSAGEAKELVELAAQKDRRIFVDHTCLFTPAYKAFKRRLSELDAKEKGLYLSNRSDYGSFPKDCGIVHHLLYHDLYLVNDLFGLDSMTSSSVFQSQIISKQQTDFGVIHLTDRAGRSLHLQASMASPVKIRQISFATPSAALTWDDTLAEDKVQLYRGSTRIETCEINKKDPEALRGILDYSARCLKIGESAINEGRHALSVLKFIENLRPIKGDA
jgi:predicted dehydrogenase